jgi:hypothetical protein
LTFTIQGNDPTALGGSGGALGYGGIANSVAIKFDLFDNAGEGNSTGLYVNGASPTVQGSVNLNGTGIDLHSGHDFSVTLGFDGSALSETITDLTTKVSVSHLYAVDIPTLVSGSTGFVGFTASTGSATTNADILSWNYGAFVPPLFVAPLPQPAPPPLPPATPSAPALAFATRAFVDLVGQITDGQLLVALAGQVDAGVPRGVVVREITALFAYQIAVVEQTYLRLLGRLPNLAELGQGLGTLLVGGSSGRRHLSGLEQLEALLLASREYFRKRGHGNQQSWLSALFGDVLGPGSKHPTLSAGSRSSLVQSLLGSEPAREGVVRGICLRYLGRLATIIELKGWGLLLQNGALEVDVLAAILGGDEYFLKALS